MRYLQAVYSLACMMWAMRLVQILAAVHLSHPEASLSGAVDCVFLLAVMPSVAGYVLLFKTIPRVLHLNRQ
ncbi:MAG TPA: hypothetical protein VLV86_10455 [Vicinamibacterales bacterium]|nr:hypothetical protein [Vicinamibacterales bacterium]